MQGHGIGWNIILYFYSFRIKMCPPSEEIHSKWIYINQNKKPHKKPATAELIHCLELLSLDNSNLHGLTFRVWFLTKRILEETVWTIKKKNKNPYHRTQGGNQPRNFVRWFTLWGGKGPRSERQKNKVLWLIDLFLQSHRFDSFSSLLSREKIMFHIIQALWDQ